MSRRGIKKKKKKKTFFLQIYYELNMTQVRQFQNHLFLLSFFFFFYKLFGFAAFFMFKLHVVRVHVTFEIWDGPYLLS